MGIVRFHAHALERMQERGATKEEEVRATVEHGERLPAKFGRSCFNRT